MNKKNLCIIIFSILIILVSCSSEPETQIKEDSFEIYIATTDSIREFGYYDTENLILKGEPILTDNDIRHYYWDQHIIELTGSYLEDIFINTTIAYDDYVINLHGLREYNTGGSKTLSTSQNMGFVIVINGEKIYSGTFPSGPELNQQEEKIILGDMDDDRIALIFTGEDFDIRNNDDIYEFFLKTGQLAQMSGDDSTELVEELQQRLDLSENSYIELQKNYDELFEEKGSANLDYTEATIDWLKNRLTLYAYETQEGNEFKRFSDSLLELDFSNLESVSMAADIFRQTAVASTEINDRMFNVFEEMYYVVIDSVSKYNSIDEIDDEFIASAKDNWITINVAGGKITAYPLIGKLRENFGVFLSPQLNEYLLIKDLERGVLDKTEAPDVLTGDVLEIEFEYLAEFINLWEKFTTDFPYAYPFNFKAKNRTENLLDIYIGKTVLMESPIYDEETLVINDTAIESYNLFMEEYSGSTSAQVISDLYVVLNENAFVYSDIVKEYIDSVDYSDYQ